MKLCFIPGFACRASMFSSLRARFPNSVYVDWDLDTLPTIKTMSDLEHWILETYDEELSDIEGFVGHSLGGGLAFSLSLHPRFANRPVILVDYFLSMPPEFFRNYCADATPADIKAAVQSMLDATRPYFDRDMPNTTPPYTKERLEQRAAVSQAPLHAIYGMRSESEEESVARHLGYPPEIRNQLRLHFIRDAAHFIPMEKPEELADLIEEIISGQET